MFKDTLDIHGFIILLFRLVDDWTGALGQHGQAKLHPREIVSPAPLKRMTARRIGGFLFWLKTTGPFPNLPDFTRLCRLFHQYAPVVEVFFKQPGGLPVDWGAPDSVQRKAILPTRESRSPKRWIGKSKSKGRWDVRSRCPLGLTDVDALRGKSVFSLCKKLLGLNQIQARTRKGFELAVSSIFALFNLPLENNRRLGLFAEKPAIAHFFCL